MRRSAEKRARWQTEILPDFIRNSKFRSIGFLLAANCRKKIRKVDSLVERLRLESSNENKNRFAAFSHLNLVLFKRAISRE